MKLHVSLNGNFEKKKIHLTARGVGQRFPTMVQACVVCPVMLRHILYWPIGAMRLLEPVVG